MPRWQHNLLCTHACAQGWPELVDILYDMNRTRNVSVYLAAYRGRAVAVKMMRSHMSMDGRPGEGGPGGRRGAGAGWGGGGRMGPGRSALRPESVM